VGVVSEQVSGCLDAGRGQPTTTGSRSCEVPKRKRINLPVPAALLFGNIFLPQVPTGHSCLSVSVRGAGQLDTLTFSFCLVVALRRLLTFNH